MKEKAEIVDPLVSIIVITYNSAKYVLETLESAKAQTYQNIELIVSDDCSTDNTVEICRNWIKENGERFVRTELITAEKNTGIAPNCNRGLFAAKGEWVKLIAGDDILLPNSIQLNLDFFINNNHADIILSQVQLFSDNKSLNNEDSFYPLHIHEKYFNFDPTRQYKSLLLENFVWNAPSCFTKRDVYFKLGLFNEEYSFIEDYPFWLNATKNNYKLYFFPQITALYRQSGSITRINDKWFNEKYFNSFYLFYRKEIKKELREINYSKYVEKNFFFLRIELLLKIFNNKRSIFSKVFNKSFIKISQSIVYIIKIFEL